MIEKEILVFAFMVSLKISAQNPDSDYSYQNHEETLLVPTFTEQYINYKKEGIEKNQNPDSDFSRFDFLSPNQNRIGHGVYEVSYFFRFKFFFEIL
jgi:hypothetical protein